MKVFGVPISSSNGYKNYNRTITKKLIHEINIENELLNSNSLWGIKSGKLSTWKNAQKGDFILFYRNGEIISCCEIIDKFQDIDLSISLWGHFEVKHHPITTFSLILILSDPQLCKIPFKKLNPITGYDDNYRLRSFFELKNLGEYIKNNYQTNIIQFIKDYSL